MNTSVDVVSILRDAEEVLRMDHYKAIPDDLQTARAAVAALIDVASRFDSYKSSDFGDTSILDNEDLWNRLSAALTRVKGA